VRWFGLHLGIVDGRDGDVKATVFDAVGRQAKVLHAGPQPAGVRQLCWETETSGHRTSSGAYFVRNAGLDS